MRVEARDAFQDRRSIENACLVAMERTLELDHPACQEGALHGLAHFHDGYAARVEAAVDEFLHRRRTSLEPELRAYALDARSGSVL